MANHVDENDRFIDQYPTEIFCRDNLLKDVLYVNQHFFLEGKYVIMQVYWMKN